MQSNQLLALINQALEAINSIANPFDGAAQSLGNAANPREAAVPI
jgi:hypothetical protein